jgi:hypothetical protein
MNQQIPRRSLSEALQTVDLPPEALELIRDGRPKPRTSQTVEVAQRQEGENSGVLPVEKGVILSRMESESAHDPDDKGEVRPSKPRRPRELDVGARRTGGSVSRSFRLPLQLATELLRVATERKINALKPFTQEEITIEALTQWLKRNGYVS